LNDGGVFVYSPSAMTLRTSRLLLTIAIFLVCGLAVARDAVAQAIPKETEREKKSASVRRERRKQVRQKVPTTSKTATTSVESDHFLDLGDRFKEQQKWKAAEAAYKEAVNVWPGNAEALQELGYLYLTISKIADAQKTYNQLRSINGGYASELLADITRRKSMLDH
jgi:tetratricopeptide (TPR) repeat protein